MDQEKDRKEFSPEELEEKLGGTYPDRARETFREKIRDMIAKKMPRMEVVYGAPGMRPARPAKAPSPEQCEVLDVYGGPEYFGAPEEEPEEVGTESVADERPQMTLVYAAPEYEEKTETKPSDPFSSEFLVVYGGPPVMPSMAEMMAAVYAGPDYFNSGIPGSIMDATVSSDDHAGETAPPQLEEGQWSCPVCGAVNTGKFCMECGSLRPKEEEKE